jgi:hypothetical protein
MAQNRRVHAARMNDRCWCVWDSIGLRALGCSWLGASHQLVGLDVTVERRRRFGRLFHLQREQPVGTGPTEVDRGDLPTGGSRPYSDGATQHLY